MKSVLDLRLVIGFVVLSVSIIWSNILYNSIIDFNLYQDVEITLLMCLKYIFYSNRYVQLIIIIIAILGLFKSNYIGWIAIANIFYFSLFDMIFVALPQVLSQYSPSFLEYLVVLIPLIIIAILNSFQILSKYNIRSRDKLKLNVNAMTLSLLFVSYRAYLLLYFNFGYWEILEKIK